MDYQYLKQQNVEISIEWFHACVNNDDDTHLTTSSSGQPGKPVPER